MIKFQKINLLHTNAKQIRQKIAHAKCELNQSQDYWENLYPNLNIEQFYEVLWDVNVGNNVREFIYKTLYGAIAIENKLKALKMSNGFCKVCNLEIETQKHLFLECQFKTEWRALDMHGLSEEDKMVFYFRNNVSRGTLLLVNKNIFETKWGIWLKRNKSKYN